MFGGAQEQGMRSGTVSPALCAGFGAAAALAAENFDKDAEHVERLWSLALDLLPEWTLNGDADRRYHGNLNVRREGVHGLRLLRSEERRVGKEWVRTCRYRWTPYN